MTLPFLSQKGLQERQIDGWPTINSEASCMCKIIMIFLFQLCHDPVTAPSIVLSIGLSSTRPDCTWTRFSRGASSCNVCAMSYTDWRRFTLHSHFIVVLHTLWHAWVSVCVFLSVCLCVCDWQWTIINVSIERYRWSSSASRWRHHADSAHRHVISLCTHTDTRLRGWGVKAGWLIP